MEFIKPDINIDFVGKRRIAYSISLGLIFITIISLVVHRGPNWGVDFAGGLLIQIKFTQPTTPDKIRSGLNDVNMQSSQIQSIGSAGNNEFMIRTEQAGLELEGLAQKVQESLEKIFPAGSFEVRRVDMVGPKVGQDLRDSALMAIFYAILFIVIYISGRFEMKWVMGIAVAVALVAAVALARMVNAGMLYLIIVALLVTLVVCFALKLKYALGAIIALIHDVTITVGVFSLLNREISLSIVAAILTIIRYSLNDTIIVFDRIRENLRKFRREPLDSVINTSINNCLSRTILTSGTTLLVLICLFFLGGPVIADFALAIIVGIVVGTYSSIYVASPILLIWPPEVPVQQQPQPKAKAPANRKNRKRKR